MDIRFTVSPDFSSERIAAWRAFGDWLGGRLGRRLAFDAYPGFASQREAVEEDRVDLIYATPFDAAMLVREKGFSAIARARDRSDEALVAVRDDAGVSGLFDLPPRTVIAGAADAEVTRIGMLLLQAADVASAPTRQFDTYAALAEAMLAGEVGAGIFLKQAFEDMPADVSGRLRPLVTSEIHVVHHQLMSGPRLDMDRDALRQALADMERDHEGGAVLRGLGFTGWDAVAEADVDFTIDLMETLFS